MEASLVDLRAASWTVLAITTAAASSERDRCKTSGFPGRPPWTITRSEACTPSSGAAHELPRAALVLQRWHSAHGRPQDVVIGVAGSSSQFRAHAWLGDEPQEGSGFRELARVAPR